MKSSTPDTRNKMDDNKGLKRATRRPITAIKLDEKSISLEELKSKVIPKTNNPKELKPSKGQIFRKENGYSKTMKRNMSNHGVSSVEEYKPIRKARKLKERKATQEKRSLSVAKRLSSGKSKTGKK